MRLQSKNDTEIQTQVQQPQQEEPCGFGSPFATQLRKPESKMQQQCRALFLAVHKNAGDAVGRKGVKGLLLVGHEKVPCGFGIRTGDPSNTADGAGNQGRLPAQHGLLERSEGYLSHRPLFLS